MQGLGYKGSEPFYSDFGERAIFRDISDEHAIDLICEKGGLRTALLEMVAANDALLEAVRAKTPVELPWPPAWLGDSRVL